MGDKARIHTSGLCPRRAFPSPHVRPANPGFLLRPDMFVDVDVQIPYPPSIPAAMRLGSEFMPPLDEGTLFYMPSTMPGISRIS